MEVIVVLSSEGIIAGISFRVVKEIVSDGAYFVVLAFEDNMSRCEVKVATIIA